MRKDQANGTGVVDKDKFSLPPVFGRMAGLMGRQ